ncbi:hypothetical protein UA08_03408 [Talaromyces atroroseus]|uniref:SIS domain-containing protein n=1 Tax=Talaromyces atroroseus TaxID=1441469 RepID=A0A225AZP8_TALAT|nr:hypothetical protein UA08_03408 [Talaromyces atroroseus]OKL61189.1 hypothetical protein UA08_03408 [Talaromyces atroroseus]
MPSTTALNTALNTALHVITTERDALSHLELLYRTNDLAQKNIDRAVAELVRTIKRGGKLVVCGVGKSGKIGRKLEATMNSVGIHSVFLHPTEALHGDLGMIRPVRYITTLLSRETKTNTPQLDTLLLISFSGRTPELLLMLPHIPQTVPVIAITSHAHPSTCPLLSFNSPDMTILLPAPLHIDEETSFGLAAPTSSTTVALALGDALALATAQSLHTLPGQGPSEIFKGYHPGGAIGAAVARDNASAISTPATSMTTSPSLSSLEDALPIKLTFDDDDDDDNEDEDNMRSTSSKTRLDTVCASEHFVPIECIPTVVPSSQSPETTEQIRKGPQILDLLLTTIQNPASKLWVKLSDTHIIPPPLLRSMTMTMGSSSSSSTTSTIIDTNAYTLSTTHITSVPSNKWLRVRASSTMDEIRCILFSPSSPSTDTSPSDQNKPYRVISVTDDVDSDKVLGFICADDV